MKEIIGISKIRDIRENIGIIMKTHMTRISIELATETKIGIKLDTSTEMTAMKKIEAGLEKNVAYLRQGKLTTS